MATLKITFALTGLRDGVADQVTADSPLTDVLASIRTIASDALPLVPSMSPLEAQGRLLITMDAGSLPSVAGPDAENPTGFVTYQVCTVVDDVLAYNHQDPGGAAYAYVEAVTDGIGTMFSTLPDLNGFMEAIGIESVPTQVHIGSSVQLFG